MYIDKLEGRQAVRVDITSLGTRLYAHCSAVGKVLLAYRPVEDVRRIIELEGMPGFTPNTIISLDALEQELVKIRKQGYAYDEEEILTDLCCVGAPVRNYTGHVIAALSMSVPTYRFRRSEMNMRKAVISAAKTIGERLGYYGN